MAWVYEEKFNTLSDGDLNGQDSWSISTTFDVQTSVTYEGAKAVANINPTGELNGYRAFTATADGTVYFAMRRSANNSGKITTTMRSSDPLTQWKISMLATGRVAIDDGNAENDWFAYSANTWYLFECVYTTTTIKARYNTGTGWSSYSTTYTPLRANSISRIYLTCEDAGTASNYWDTITPTNPLPSVSSTPVPTLTLMGAG